MQKVSPLTGAIKVVGDGVQEGVLWSEEPLHHRHLDQLEKSATDSQAAAAAASISSEDLRAAPRWSSREDVSQLFLGEMSPSHPDSRRRRSKKMKKEEEEPGGAVQVVS